jgi:hypothetical protein
MWICSNCGEEITEGVKTCPRCGAEPKSGVTSSDAQREIAANSVVLGASADGTCLTRFEIAVLACRILALWLFAEVVTNMSSLLLLVPAVLFGQGLREAFGAAGIMPFFYIGTLIAAIFIWKKAPYLARRMVDDSSVPVRTVNMDQQNWMVLACTAIGLYALWNSSYGLAQKLSQIIYFSRQYGFENADLLGNINWMSDLWAQLGSLAFGLWLLLGSRGVVRLIQRLRKREPSPYQNAPDAVPDES